MPSALTEVEVWNLALDHVAEMPLATTGDSTAYGRWLNRNVAHLRDVLTRMYPWNFAIQYNELTEDATAPAFRFSARYPLPTDWLRVIPPTYLGGRGNRPLEFEVVGNFIHVNIGTTLQLRTVQRITDFTEWDPVAIDALALLIAYRMTKRFSGLSTHRDRLQQEFADATRLAAEMDAFESTAEPVEQHTVLDVRDT